MCAEATPKRSSSSRRSGASALVVHDAFDTIRASPSASSLAPSTTVASAAGEGPEISTASAPARRPRSATSRVSARPVHSSATSTPERSRRDRSASREKGISRPSTTSASPRVPTEPGNGPNTLSNSKR